MLCLRLLCSLCFDRFSLALLALLCFAQLSISCFDASNNVWVIAGVTRLLFVGLNFAQRFANLFLRLFYRTGEHIYAATPRESMCDAAPGGKVETQWRCDGDGNDDDNGDGITMAHGNGNGNGSAWQRSLPCLSHQPHPYPPHPLIARVVADDDVIFFDHVSIALEVCVEEISFTIYTNIAAQESPVCSQFEVCGGYVRSDQPSRLPPHPVVSREAWAQHIQWLHNTVSQSLAKASEIYRDMIVGRDGLVPSHHHYSWVMGHYPALQTHPLTEEQTR
jgi:hypothetical protein